MFGCWLEWKLSSCKERVAVRGGLGWIRNRFLHNKSFCQQRGWRKPPPRSTPRLPSVLSAGRRPAQVCGNDTARAAEIFLHFSPSRSQTGWHWLESGAARQGQSMRIDRAVQLRLQSRKISRQLKREGKRREGRVCSTIHRARSQQNSKYKRSASH